MTLDAVQQRVLGALMEKEMTTPENYPLSLNALMAACNQRSSREPVMDLSEGEVRQAVHTLEDMGVVSPVRDARVPKYEHRIRTVLNLRRDETAILCLLLLRGPQTPGELRGRAERMFSFDDIAAVQSALERMAARASEGDAASGPAGAGSTGTGPLAVQLARQPGSRESRYAHLLGGAVAGRDSGRDFGGDFGGDFGRAHSSRSDEWGTELRGAEQRGAELRGAEQRGAGLRDAGREAMEARLETMEARLEAMEAEVASLRARVEMLEGRG